jgi:hypothetical protein
LRSLILISLLTLLTLWSCTDDDTVILENPQLVLSDSSATGMYGENLSITVIAEAEAGIQSFTQNGKDISCDMSEIECVHEFKYEFQNIDSLMTIEFQLVDKLGKSATKSLIINQKSFSYPLIQLYTNSYSGNGFDEILIEGLVSADAGIQSLNINGENISEAIGFKSFDINYAYTLENVDSTIEFDFTVIDNFDVQYSATFTITQVAIDPLLRFESILINTPLNDGTSNNFFSSNSDDTYTSVEIVNSSIENIIDFGYYFGATHQATICSPLEYPSSIINLAEWSELNDTKIKNTSLTDTQFDNVANYDELENIYLNGTNETGRMTNLSVGNIFAFKTEIDENNLFKYGLIRISNIIGTYNSSDYIVLDMTVTR